MIKDEFLFIIIDNINVDFYILLDMFIFIRFFQILIIEVVFVDNGILNVFINKGIIFLSYLFDGRIGVKIISKVLQVEDRDSLVDSLIFFLIVFFDYGYFINMNVGSEVISLWI